MTTVHDGTPCEPGEREGEGNYEEAREFRVHRKLLPRSPVIAVLIYALTKDARGLPTQSRKRERERERERTVWFAKECRPSPLR